MKFILGTTTGILIGTTLGVMTLVLCIAGSQKEMPTVSNAKN